VNDELENMWKEVIVAKFDVLSEQLAGEIGETIKIVTLQAEI
jgi:hypothetical protein